MTDTATDTTRYEYRGSGPVHIVPTPWQPALCGVKIGQYVSTRSVKARPGDDAQWCTACLRHERNGTRKAWRRR